MTLAETCATHGEVDKLPLIGAAIMVSVNRGTVKTGREDHDECPSRSLRMDISARTSSSGIWATGCVQASPFSKTSTRIRG